MAENGLSERVERIENKLDALSESVDQRFNEVDQQFLEVREHFVEQRQYIEFAYNKLGKRITEGFSRLERKIDPVIDSQSRSTSATPRRARPSKRRR